MKPALLLLLAFVLPASAPSVVLAQASAAAAAPTSRTPNPPPRRLTPEELREVGGPPGEVRPEDPVVPQIKIPLGRKQPVTPLPPARRASAATGIDDTAARCLALADAAERAACREKVARSARRSPG